MRRLATVAAALLVCACNRSETDGSPSPTAAAASGSAASAPSVAVDAGPPKPKKLTRPEKPLNVLLILVDSMRNDMPWNGYERKIAPVLTELESKSVSYTRGYSISSYTAKSVAGMLAGRYPSSLYRSGYFFTRYPDSNLFFPELLQKAGITTLSGHAHMYMKRGNGMDQGFDKWEVVDGITFDNSTDRHVTSQKLTPLAIEQLEAMPEGKRFFMYLHYMDPHDQYVKHEESPDFGNKGRDRYDSEMFYTDLWIGKLFDHMKKQPWWEDTAIIVSADHGEAFGEHSMYKHAFTLYEVLVNVPFFFYVPGAKARRIDTPRGHIDVAPTVLDLMGLPPNDQFIGKSLVPELFDAEPVEARPVILNLPADSNNHERHGMIDGDYKLTVHGNQHGFELYNLKEDPGEKKNLAKVEKEKLEEMKKKFADVWDTVPLVRPFGGNKLTNGKTANGPRKPPEEKPAEEKKP